MLLIVTKVSTIYLVVIFRVKLTRLMHDMTKARVQTINLASKGIQIPESGTFRLWNPESGKFCLCDPDSWALESGIQLKESGIPLTMESRIQVTLKEWNPVPGIRYPRRGIQNPGLTLIALHGTNQLSRTSIKRPLLVQDTSGVLKVIY